MKKKTKVITFLTTGLGLSMIIGGSIAAGLLANQSVMTSSNIVENNKNTLETPNIIEKPNQSVNTPSQSINKPTTSKPNINTPIESTQLPSSKPSQNNSNKPTQDNVVKHEGKLFSQVLAKAEAPESKPNISGESQKMPSRITREFKSGMLEEQDQMFLGSLRGKASKWQSDLYYNQRDFMPIINSYDSFYANERGISEVEGNSYNGWKKDVSTKWWNGAIIQTKYVALPVLLTKTAENITLSQTEINSLKIDFSYDGYPKLQDKSTLINQYISDAANKGIQFFIIENATQSELEKIVIPANKNIKKLTIKDLKGKLTSLRGIQIPESVQELEFYSTTASKIDPTILSNKTHMIYDHVDGDYASEGRLKLQPFKTIDLSNRANLTNEDVQKAINAVYGERQYERSFHGDMVGGYIYQLDLSNTPIKSLNNVYIPSQSDGRFNIAYVQWTSGVNSHGSVTITIGGNSKYPNNDSQVNEWFDASGWAEKATKIMLNSEGEMSIESILKEIKPLFKKYPNVNTLDLTGIDLISGETHKQLADKIIELWNQIHNGDGNSTVPTLQIIHKEGIDKAKTSFLKEINETA